MNQLVEDLTNIRNEMARRGWTDGRLIKSRGDAANHGPMCMTGAIGVVLEGFEFIGYALGHDSPEGWNWSPRARQVVGALLSNRDRSYMPHGDTQLEQIVNINDHFLNRERALAWLDRTIVAVSEVPKKKVEYVKATEKVTEAQAVMA